MMRHDVDGAIVFAPCPVGCDGAGTSIHTAHRLRELGKPVPRYLETQIAFQLERAVSDVVRLTLRVKSGALGRAVRVREVIALEHRRANLLRAWLLGVPLPR
jgi:hypothetical protein